MESTCCIDAVLCDPYVYKCNHLLLGNWSTPSVRTDGAVGAVVAVGAVGAVVAVVVVEGGAECWCCGEYWCCSGGGECW